MVDRLFADAYLAQIYDLWHPRSVRDDFDFYLPRIVAAETVLDIGCGTGMLLSEARDRGHAGELCGVDPAPGMLAVARRRGNVEWVLGDATSADQLGPFDLVVMTGHAFQALVTDEALAEAMTSVRRALRPEGRFAFETRNPSARAWERWTPDNAVTVAGPEGLEVRITTRVTVPFDGATLSFEHRFEGDDARLPQVSGSTLRFLNAGAVDDLLRGAGLRVEERYGDFAGAPFAADAPEIVTIARVAG